MQFAFMFSCSNDNETNAIESSNVENNSSATTTSSTSSLPPIEDATDQMFYDYITSDVYILKQEKFSIFNSHLGSGADLSFTTRESLFSWINSNIDLTEFQSIEDAENDWIEIEGLVAQEMIEHSDIYSFIEDSSYELVTYYMGKWFNNSDTVNASCFDQFKECTDEANAAYKEYADDIKNSANSDKNEHYACAQNELKKATEVCNNKLDKCRNSQ